MQICIAVKIINHLGDEVRKVVRVWAAGSSSRVPALEWITVEGFKSIGHVERLRLLPLNVLIGPNGS